MRYYQKCKCCLEDGNLRDMWSEYIYEGQTEIYGNMIIECFSLPWEQPDEENTEHICEVCVDRLRYSLDFRRDIMSAEDIWNELLDQSEADLKMEQLMKQEQQSEEEVNEEDNNSAGNDEDYDDNEGYEILVMEHQTEAGTCKKEEQDSIFGGSQTGDMSADINKDETNAEEYYDSEGGQILVMDNASNTAVSEGTADDEDEQYLDAGSSQDERQESADGEYKPGLEDDMDIEYLEDDSEAEAVLAPKRRRGGKRSYKKYTQDELKQALRAVNEGRMSRSEAAQRYHVPVKTLGAKLRAQDGEDPEEVAISAAIKKHGKFYDEIRMILTYTNATPYKTKIGKFFCAYCGNEGPIFRDPEQLRAHTRTEHVEERVKNVDAFMKPSYLNEILKMDILNLDCTVCSLRLNDWNAMFQHLLDVHDVTLDESYTRVIPYILTEDLRCALCNEKFAHFHVLDVHMNAHYNNYICGECGDTYISESRLKKHVQTHSTKQFPCEQCGKVFTLEKYRRKHEDFVHKRISKFQCHYCEEIFVGEYPRHLHELDKHKAYVKTIFCEYCSNRFTWRPYYLKHLRLQHKRPEKRHVCRLCNKKFMQKHELKNHLDWHRGEGYTCIVCDRKFCSKSYLQKHMNEKHEANVASKNLFVILNEDNGNTTDGNASS